MGRTVPARDPVQHRDQLRFGRRIIAAGQGGDGQEGPALRRGRIESFVVGVLQIL